MDIERGRQERQRALLKELALHLWGLPENYGGFSMAHFCRAKPGEHQTPSAAWVPHQVSLVHELHEQCGTVACAAGHIPILRDAPLPREKEGWLPYIRRAVGIGYYNNSNDYRWMFSGKWASIDNTPHGAARRIWYYLLKSVHRDHLGRFSSRMPMVSIRNVSLYQDIIPGETPLQETGAGVPDSAELALAVE